VGTTGSILLNCSTNSSSISNNLGDCSDGGFEGKGGGTKGDFGVSIPK